MPDANALDVRQRVIAKLDELKKSFPEGLDYDVGFDTTPYTRESIREVFRTLRDAIILVAVVVLLFLQNWRISHHSAGSGAREAVIGTFAVMLAAFGFRPSTTSPLFGLVLTAIGIVVDDAIVVVEAVEHHIEEGAGPAHRHNQGHESGVRTGHRRSVGAQCRVRALCLHWRHHGHVLPTVRTHHRRFHDHLRLQFVDVEPGVNSSPAQAPKQAIGPAFAPILLRNSRRLDRLRLPESLFTTTSLVANCGPDWLVPGLVAALAGMASPAG